MNDSKILAKMIFFSVAALLLTGFMLCIVIYYRPSSLFSFVIGGVTFSTWFSLIELVAAYLEEQRYEKFH